MDSLLLKIFSSKVSLVTEGIIIMMTEKGIPQKRLDVDVSQPPDLLLDINPQLILPTLYSRDLVVYHPEIILVYLNERYPHPQMLPGDPAQRARFRIALKVLLLEWYPTMQKLAEQFSQECPLDKKLIKQQTEHWRHLGFLIKDYTFFQSDSFSMLDCMIAPLLAWVAKLQMDMPSHSEKLIAYNQRILERTSVRHVYPFLDKGM